MLFQLSRTRQIALKWITAHCVVPGNEKADELAKLSAKEDQPLNKINYEEKATVIKTIVNCKLSKHDYHLQDRQEQVFIFRLRTDYNRLNAHTYAAMNRYVAHRDWATEKVV